MKNKRLTSGYISSFCMELHLILHAGIPLDEGINILRDGESDNAIRQLLTDVYATLLEGCPLHIALERTEAFPRYMVDMIRVGEETGNLDRGLKALADYYTRQEQLSQNLRRAVLYPTVLLMMLTLVMVILIVEVLPMFNDVYAQLGGTMSGLGAGILAFGMMLKSNWIVAIVLVIAILSAVILWTMRGQKTGERVLLSKKLGTAVATSKLTSALAMALHSGLDMDMSIALAEQLTEHPAMNQKLKNCRAKMAEGAPFANVVSEEYLLPSLYCRMLGVGIKTGTTDQVMEDIAQRSDAAAQEAIDRYVGNVEPTLVVIMSVLVGAVLLSVMLPLASIMSSLG